MKDILSSASGWIDMDENATASKLIEAIGPKSILELWGTDVVIENNLSKKFPKAKYHKQFDPSMHYDFVVLREFYDPEQLYDLLTRMVKSALYVYIDGAYSNENIASCLAIFQFKFRSFIHKSRSFYKFQGGLLFEFISGGYSENNTNYAELKESYDENYYLSDCGGYDTFRASAGKQIDNRLSSIFLMANPNPEDNILDVGCGRGELAAFISKNSGARVVGLDYSSAAIGIAKKTYRLELGDQLDYIQQDIFEYNPVQKYNKVIAADVVEHIESGMLEKMFEKIAHALITDDGILLIHTAPNLQYYQISYELRRQQAQQAGVFLPKNPRTAHERQMHINEQNRWTLQESLKKHFPFVETWVGSPHAILENKPQDTLETAQFLDIFAIASKKPLNLNEQLEMLQQKPLTAANEMKICLSAESDSIKASPEQRLLLPVRIDSMSNILLSSQAPNPIHLSYHIWNESGEMVLFEGNRTLFQVPLFPKSTVNLRMDITAPCTKGRYELRPALVQEGCFWNDDGVQSNPIVLVIE